jgi:microcin C transport system permease protein
VWLYLLKRLFAMIPTLLGVLTAQSERSGAEGAQATGAWSYSGRQRIHQQQLEQLSKLYGFDKPPLERYWTMLAMLLTFVGEALRDALDTRSARTDGAG